jgi:hypothetical protein
MDGPATHRSLRLGTPTRYIIRDRDSVYGEICLDHVVVFGERHLCHVLLSYMHYYNSARTHLSLNKDAPLPREAVGRILPTPILGGLHHHYVRI